MERREGGRQGPSKGEKCSGEGVAVRLVVYCRFRPLMLFEIPLGFQNGLSLITGRGQ